MKWKNIETGERLTEIKPKIEQSSANVSSRNYRPLHMQGLTVLDCPIKHKKRFRISICESQ